MAILPRDRREERAERVAVPRAADVLRRGAQVLGCARRRAARVLPELLPQSQHTVEPRRAGAGAHPRREPGADIDTEERVARELADVHAGVPLRVPVLQKRNSQRTARPDDTQRGDARVHRRAADVRPAERVLSRARERLQPDILAD